MTIFAEPKPIPCALPYAPNASHETRALTVTELNRQVRSWLEHEVGDVTVIGELSNVSRPQSGHLYFTLKDQGAQVRCVHFRNHQDAQSHRLSEGQQVIAKGKISLYEPRGDYQLTVRSLSEAGQGDLYRAFELLVTKLKAQGLFDPDKKKPLPRYPSTIGIVTSLNAAALQDILTTLKTRYPYALILIYPSEVQGKDAPRQLIQALRHANQPTKNESPRADVIILARGGGSIEDLWAFNGEALALAITQSQIPIVSGVGHETDFTIADFVADHRAATPTAAAQAVTPHQADLVHALAGLIQHANALIQKRISQERMALSAVMAQLTSPETLICKHTQTLDYLSRQLEQAERRILHRKTHQHQLILTQLQANNPSQQLKEKRQQLDYLSDQLWQEMAIVLTSIKNRFTTLLTTLNTVSPLSTLTRGYAIVSQKTERKKQSHIVLDSRDVSVGDRVHIRLARGELECRVESRDDG